MNTSDWLPFNAPLESYQQQAASLMVKLQSGKDEARWSFKWSHPRFHGRPVADVDASMLHLADAQLVIARLYAFDTWADLADFTSDVGHDDALRRFESAADAVVSGDLNTLRSLLSDDPQLSSARSRRRHHASLLHYIAANGVEESRQQTPENAVAVAQTLLDAGAEVDALADMYAAKCTTMSMLVSSDHPAKAGVQAALAETLLDHGAAFSGPGTNWQSAVMTALAFGYLRTAQALVRRGTPVDNLAMAAGLGRYDDAIRMLPDADERSKHIALALAAQHGHLRVVQLLIDAGEDPNRYNPDGYHSHSTPLHQATAANHIDVVQWLVSRGARLDIEDTVYHGTPLDWAEYGGHKEIASHLRAQGH